MDTISVWHWLFAIFIIVALGVSDIEYLATGYSRWWTIVYFISLLNIAFVWVLACGLQLIGRLRFAGERAPLQRNAAKGYVWFWPKIAAALSSKTSLVDYDRRGCVWRGLRSAGVAVVASRKPAAYNDEKDADYKPQPYKNLYLSEPLALFGIRVSLRHSPYPSGRRKNCRAQCEVRGLTMPR